jgi:hypothetical protein
MSPRIRNFLTRPFYARAAKPSVAQNASAPPNVFREFVETLQKLDAGRHPPGNGAAQKRAFGARRGNGARRHLGNGRARPRRRPRPYS